MTSLFMGMISAFLGLIICNLGFIQVTDPETQVTQIVFNLAAKDFIPLLVMFVSAIAMAICGLLMKKLKWNWMNDYALPISMLVGMITAIPITAWLA